MEAGECDLEIEPRRDLLWIDYAVIVGYFVFVIGVGLYSSYRSKRASVSGYFLASRSMHWVPVGASLFASNIGSGHFIGLAGSGAASGIAIAGFELNAIFVVMFLGWVFVPVYMAAGVYTMPEYLRLRFGGQRIRVYLASLALILYIFTKISADLYAGAIFIQMALGFEGDSGLYISIVILLGIAALFTIAGGLTAVIWTDFVQTILMLIGATILCVMAFSEVGGYSSLIEKYMASEPSSCATQYDRNNVSCGAVDPAALHLFRAVDTKQLPWTGLIFGTTISSIWYWCSDQVIVQRTLASKNMTHAKAGCLLAGFLKLFPMFLLVFPGMVARILYTDKVACANPEYCNKVCGSESGCTNIAYAELVMNLLSPGLTGMMLAVMMAALMSSLTSIFNSSSTIFTMDIWTRFRKNPSDTELLMVGRLSILCLLVISILWVPILKNIKSSQLFVYIQSVSNFLSPPVTATLFDYIQANTSFLSPPICAVYLCAIFTQRINEKGAFWGLMIGLVLGIIRFVMEFSFVAPSCGPDEFDTRPGWIASFVDFHYLHFGVVLFIITGIITFVISYFTEPIDPECLHRLTFATRHSIKVRKAIDLQEFQKQSDEQAAKIPSVLQVQEERPVPGLAKKLFNIACGVEDESNKTSMVINEEPKLTPEEEAVESAKFLDETKFWKTFVNGCAIAIGILTIAVWIYWA